MPTYQEDINESRIILNIRKAVLAGWRNLEALTNNKIIRSRGKSTLFIFLTSDTPTNELLSPRKVEITFSVIKLSIII